MSLTHENHKLLGIAYATSAAALNGTIGIFSILLMDSQLNSHDVAFFKTLIAVIFLNILLSKTTYRKQKQIIVPSQSVSLAKFLTKLAICAFCGIFVLFYFETLAYSYGNASDVVIVLMASAALSALFFGVLLLQEKLSLGIIAGVALAITGVFIISWVGENSYLLLLNSTIAGAGYGLFTVLVKKFKFAGGIFLTNFLMLLGLCYLAVPFFSTMHAITVSPEILLGILCLALFPTVLGFYCTTKSLQYLEASKVQVTELSEPIFSMLFAWLFLSQSPNSSFFLGSGFILLGILLMNAMLKKPTRKSHNQ